MKSVFRATFAVAIASAIACGPILGLDDLYGRAKSNVSPDGATEGGTDGGKPCKKTSECQQPNGSAAVCAAGTCVPVADFCSSEVLPSNKVLEEESVALVAAFVPFQGGLSPLTNSQAFAYKLALEELSGGIPYNDQGSTKRQYLAVVLCPSEVDMVEESVKHVTHQLHVSAMIGSFDNTALPAIVQNHARPEDVFVINPNTASEALRFQQEPLLWNLLGVAEDIAVAYRPLLEGLERHLRADGTVGGTDPLRVALLTTNTSLEESIRDVLERGGREVGGGFNRNKALKFNGLNLPDMTNEPGGGRANYLSIPVAAYEKFQNADYVKIQNDLTSFAPHVVIALTSGETERIVRSLESTDGGPGLRPTWVLGPRNAGDLRTYLGEDGLAASGKQERFLGVQYALPEDRSERDAWLTRMENMHGPPGDVDYKAAENYYDAVYWLAYAAAYRDGPLSGTVLSAGVRRLLAGSTIYAGPPAAVGNAFQALGANGQATFVGALGPPDIDARLGVWNSVGGVYCYVVEQGVVVPKYDVLRYQRATGKLAQPSHCFPGQFADFGL